MRQKQEFVLSKLSCPLELELEDAWCVPFCFGLNSLLAKKRKKKKDPSYRQIKKHIEEYKIIDYDNDYNDKKTQTKEQHISGSFKLGRSNLKINKNGWLYFHEKVFTKIINFMHDFFSNLMVSGCDKVIVVGGFANSK
eukprot:551272_1